MACTDVRGSVIAPARRLRWVTMASGMVALATSISGCAHAGVSDKSSPTELATETTTTLAAPTSTSVRKIGLGSCTGDLGDGDITKVEEIPCGQPHWFEAFSTSSLPDGDYPGDGVVSDSAQSLCAKDFNTFVGMDFNESQLEMKFLVPSAQTWAAGDRVIVCFVGEDAGGQTTGSLRAADR